VRSSLCLVHFSSAGHDGSARAVDEDAFMSLVNKAWIPSYIDMTLSVIKLRSTSIIYSSIAVSSSDIRARD
jgi:hypothetical protein